MTGLPNTVWPLGICGPFWVCPKVGRLLRGSLSRRPHLARWGIGCPFKRRRPPDTESGAATRRNPRDKTLSTHHTGVSPVTSRVLGWSSSWK